MEKVENTLFDKITELLIDGDNDNSIKNIIEFINSEMSKKENELQDKYLRLMAEYDNYRKRSLKDREQAIENSKIKTIDSILNMHNDISYALKNINDDEKEGIVLILNKFNDFFNKENITEIQTETYDTDLHEVISILPSDEDNKIIDVISKGYMINDKPFKYPKIILGKI